MIARRLAGLPSTTLRAYLLATRAMPWSEFLAWHRLAVAHELMRRGYAMPPLFLLLPEAMS